MGTFVEECGARLWCHAIYFSDHTAGLAICLYCSVFR